MNPSQIQQMYAESCRALSTGGFAAFYQAQLASFQKYCPNFNLNAFRAQTNRAVCPLQSVQNLMAYNICYAADHYARFEHLLTEVGSFSTQVLRPPVRLCVFDYGCGQGLATLALLSHLQDRHVELIINLIEPSALALDAAECYVKALADRMQGQVVVHSHQKGLDQLPDDIFIMPEGFSAVHLFSNVLDMAHHKTFDLSCLTQRLNQIQGKHLCLAVSPKFYSGKLGFAQLKSFFKPSKMFIDREDWRVTARGYRFTERGMVLREVEGQYMAFIRCVTSSHHVQVA